ncbi:FxsB family cyclophane-forming radical SAM/SPASM peptide maturase [Streptomyces sp. NPDC005722]
MEATRPIHEFVVKVHGRCNLACSYCYVYELRDSSWQHKPAVLSRALAERLATRIAEHAERHRLPSVRVVLHGGEPLLAGRGRVEHLLQSVQGAAHGITSVEFAAQTNGTLLNPGWMDLFRRHGVRVGVSLDGGRDASDRHRRTHGGRSSHAAAERGIGLLRRAENAGLYGGLLCTVDLANDPLVVYEALLSHRPPLIDLLLPHATWEFPPPGHDPATAPYGRWLRTVFDRWYAAPVRETRIRMFETIMDLVLGGRATAEAVGLDRPPFVVVDTDGSIEQPDSLKAAYEGATALGLDIGADDFDTAAAHPLLRDQGRGLASLSAECRACDVVRLCGGGLRAHRYRPSGGFANPSVYCADLKLLTEHIRDRVTADVRALIGGAS